MKMPSEYRLQDISAPADRAHHPPAAAPVNALSAGIFAVVFLQRFAINLAGYPVQAILIVVLAVLAYLVWQGAARLDSVRLIGFLCLACVLALEGFITGDSSSVTSLGLLMVMYFLATLVVPMSHKTYVALLHRFQIMMVIAAVMGMVQFFAQFVLPAEYLFSFQHFVPSELLLPRFNTVIPLQHGSSLFKSNGFVFIEPSTFSQFLAVAIIIELAAFHTGWRLAVFALAYLFTYSGTGLIVLAASLPLFLGSIQPRHFLAGGIVILVALTLAGTALNLEVFVERASSFDNEHSSAFARFVGPWLWIRDVQMDNSLAIFFGFGAGSVETLAKTAHIDFHDPTWAKVIMEYGLVGALAFFSFYLYCVFSFPHHRRINWALFVMFTVTGGALLNPFMACPVLLLAIVPVQKQQDILIQETATPRQLDSRMSAQSGGVGPLSGT